MLVQRISKRQILKVFLTLFLPFFLAASSLLYVFDQNHWNESKETLVKQIGQHHQLQIQSIENNLSNLLVAFYFLSQDIHLFQQLSQKDNLQEHDIQDILNFIRANQSIDQCRLLDLDGHEIFRIHQHQPGQPVVVPKELLQNKQERSYYKEAMPLTRNHYIFSDLDLNIENGDLEYPLKPTLRISMPIYNQGKKLGVLVVNYLSYKILADIRHNAYLGDGELMVLNQAGFFLSHPNPEQEWGFAVPGREKFRFENQFPDFWPIVSKNENGNFFDLRGLVVFDQINLGALDISHLPIRPSSQNPPKWTIVTFVSKDSIREDHYQRMTSIYLGYASLIFLLTFFSIYLAWHQQRLAFSESQKRAQNELLLKRNEELHFLYDISRLTESDRLEFKEMVGQLIELIPRAWTYRESCVACITIDGYSWHSKNYRQPVVSQREEIVIEGQSTGFLEVGYIFEPPGEPFLPQENELLTSLALRIKTVHQFQLAQKQIFSHQDELERKVVVRTLELEEANARMLAEIAERQILTEGLEQAKKAAEEATKVKTAFLSLVAHDLKSPFFSILGILRRIVKKEPNLDPKHRQLMESSIESGQRLLDMVDKLININKIQTGRIRIDNQEYHLFDLIEPHIHQYQDAADQKGIILQNLIPTDAIVVTDGFLFGEVVANLLSNSIKFCSSGDQVTLYVPKGKNSTLVVEDNGLGIEPAIIEYLFEEQYSTTTLGTLGEKGTGLGLPYCSDIMKLLKGNISVESEPNKGAKFSLSLPEPSKKDIKDHELN
ncbi:MAG: hypothetical protein A2508_09015 [Candidatus Lambdaproteobacteria bacterium RIFOXYD12_FULL_49_8]|uniref:histidine kinase n=1 Tax=Candidatus Lambdaproteobacteria bacterium RIFOXYD2_FULL_50_16 TaxID=1817772 RepID=A0A1F6GAM9_9PROT|nr:MAG: hypothetical protein A2527_08345 [Candidatus Lambdaproteobacteria bacterium RIFOXYD2_FULL_50_16]OGG97938.1 MAG: hypothetical protein A2508_09015 [Candidatus Lambdaproteobacteria bacterium RIFOXYD12_FULL_49_8]